ncbi:MAG: tyrosine-type recombinase/integrase [Veillonellaceae bacterium]|nr:tyrosine-type recombinase/integrase [Veillonellaceae bacterium]
MCPTPAVTSIAGAYDRALIYARDKHLPAGVPRPIPTRQWPLENVRLLERYYAWLIAGGTAEQPTRIIYLPAAGHVLGLNPVPHPQINLESDFEKVMAYVQAKKVSVFWVKACRNGLEKFRRFLRIERGLGEVSKITPFDVAKYTAGFPAWLVSELERYQRIQQKHWRIARLDLLLRGFWSKHGQLWRFFCQERGVEQLADLKRAHILDYVDSRLAAGASIASVNLQIHLLHGFLLFLQEEGYTVPQAILRIPSLKPPDSLPKYLTDEQVGKLRDEIEGNVNTAQNAHQLRQALLDRATFYLLWQGGMRLGEVEDLRLENLDVPGQRLSVRSGKNLKDRTVYLTEHVLLALKEYLSVRGEGSSDHVFLYRNAALSKDLIRSRLKTIGTRIGVKVYPHRLRHTCASQLLNAGCRITSIQAFLGHKKLNTTMIYARAYDQTVADDYFAAMSRVEQRMEITPLPKPAEEPNQENEVVKEQENPQLVTWLERLALPELCLAERLEIVDQLKYALALTLTRQHAPPIMVAEAV